MSSQPSPLVQNQREFLLTDMIVIEKEIPLPSLEYDEINCCETFRGNNDRLKVAISVGFRRSSILFVDFPTGSIEDKFEIDEDSVIILRDIPGMKCLVTEVYRRIYSCDYSGEKVIVTEDICPGIKMYPGKMSICAIDDDKFAFISDKELITFFDFRKRVVYKELALRNDKGEKCLLTRLLCCGGVHPNLLFVVGWTEILGSKTIFTLNTETFEVVAKIPNSCGEHAIDYSGKFSVVCDEDGEDDDEEEEIFLFQSPPPEGLIAQVRFPDGRNEDMDSEVGDDSFHSIMYIYGKDCMMGKSASGVHLLQNKKWSLLGKRCERPSIRNNGRDIIMVMNELENSAKIMHLVNTCIISKELDEYEKERVEYIHNIDNFEGQELQLINIGEFMFFKSFVL